MQLALALSSPRMRIAVLGSGSGGNATVIESGPDRLLVEAGFSCREIERRLSKSRIPAEGFVGVVVTHEHSDHASGARAFAARHSVPIWATRGTLARMRIGGRRPPETRVLRCGRADRVGPFSVHPFTVSHDAAEPVGLVVEDRSGCRAGLVADLGGWTDLALERLKELDYLLLETNHDPEMLEKGPYPARLKRRVAGRRGHLSNEDAAAGLERILDDRLQWVVLYHLSRTNNRPALAVDSIGERLAACGSKARIALTHQIEPSGWLELTC